VRSRANERAAEARFSALSTVTLGVVAQKNVVVERAAELSQDVYP
jgi:hypothetical protein